MDYLNYELNFEGYLQNINLYKKVFKNFIIYIFNNSCGLRTAAQNTFKPNRIVFYLSILSGLPVVSSVFILLALFISLSSYSLQVTTRLLKKIIAELYIKSLRVHKLAIDYHKIREVKSLRLNYNEPLSGMLLHSVKNNLKHNLFNFGVGGCIQSRRMVSLSDSSSNINLKLDPNYITGFTDAEGYFSIRLIKSIKVKTGWSVTLHFGFNVHLKDQKLLKEIQSFFKVGNIFASDNDCQFIVSSLKDLEAIIDHFDNYPLVSQKYSDYQLFKLAFYLVKNKEHLTEEGLNKLISLKSSSNLGLSDKLKEAFPNVMAIARPLVKDRVIKDPNWMAGFIDGEGCFNINIIKAKDCKSGYQVKARFILAQHSRDLELMLSIKEYLGCGTLSNTAKTVSSYLYLTVSKFKDINEKIIPLLNKYPLPGSKKSDFNLFCYVIALMKDKAHTTSEGIAKIQAIKAKMNRGNLYDE